MIALRILRILIILAIPYFPTTSVEFTQKCLYILYNVGFLLGRIKKTIYIILYLSSAKLAQESIFVIGIDEGTGTYPNS